MKDTVCRSTHSHDNGDSILKGLIYYMFMVTNNIPSPDSSDLLCHDISSPYLTLKQCKGLLHHSHTVLLLLSGELVATGNSSPRGSPW